MSRPLLLGLVGVLLALLTTLLLNGRSPHTADLDRGLVALERFEDAQHALRRDIISVRAGLLHSYDPLVGDIAALKTALGDLRELERDEAAPLIARLAVSVRHQEELTETLKSDSALLRNSLAFFSTLSDQPAAPSLASYQASRLSGAMLRLLVDSSRENQVGVDRRIAELQAVVRPPGDERQSWSVLLGHARLLRNLLPRTDVALSELLAEDRAATRTGLRAWIEEERRAAERRAQINRLALYATAVALVAALGFLALRLIGYLRALRRRSELEHGLATLSAELIAAAAHEAPMRLHQALRHLGLLLGSKAAFLVGRGIYDCEAAWVPPDLSLASDWAANLLDQAPTGRRTTAGWALMQLGNAPGEASVNAVAAIGLGDDEGNTVILVFDVGEDPWDADDEALNAMRLALGLLAGAVRRWRFEERQAVTEKRLQQALRMEAVGSFASGVAHNFNNILNAIGGYAEMTTDRPSARGVVLRYATEIGRGVDRARQLVEQILQFGKPPLLPAGLIDMGELLTESVAMLAASHNDGVLLTLDLNLGPGLLMVRGGAAELQQIALNLGVNAVAALARDHEVKVRGRVDFGLRRSRLDQPKLCATGPLACGDYAVLTVADEGTGMSEATMARIFDPFFTTRAQGNGLGLATVAETARLLGGAVDVHSTCGEGSRFEVWLPLTSLDLPAGHAGCQEDGENSVPGCGQTLLLVGVDLQSLAHDEDLIAALGYEPVGALGREGALTVLAADPSRFDAAVVVWSAEADILGLVAALRELSPGLKVVMASPTAMRARPVTAKVRGCVTTAWPLQPGAFASAVRSVLVDVAI